MARKNVLIPLNPVSTGQSLAADFISPVTVITYMDNCSYQINITTTDSVGTFSVQGCLDYQLNDPNNTEVLNAGNWIDLILGGTGSPSASAANDQILIDLNQVPFKALRIAYTSSVAGTGTCDIYFMAKQVGG